jgi:SH3-like domain-containing protein
MPETQYRVNPTGANLREEASTKARVLTLLAPGTIVHLDHVDGDWLYVEVRGWVHQSTVTVLKGE